MSRRNRIFAGILIVYFAGIAFLLYRIVGDLDPRYRESSEDNLIEIAQVLASLVEQDVRDGEIDTSSLATIMKDAYAREFEAQVFDFSKNRVELRVYVTDRSGKVLYDSTGRATGGDYSGWRDVTLTLAGFYGARTTPDVAGDRRTAVMYVGAPIRSGQSVIGVVTVGKPTQSFGQFVDAARDKIILVGAGSAVAVVVLAFIVSIWLVRPFGLVGDAARALVSADRRDDRRDERRGAFRRFARQVRRTPIALREAYRDMRDAVAGRSYVEDYVQTLTHELKSPLSAISGAAELLEEAMPEEDRRRFVGNIVRETARIRELADRMLELAVLEQRKRIDAGEPVDAQTLGVEVASTTNGADRGIHVEFRIEPIRETIGKRPMIDGDAFLLRRALANLIDNAIDFSPAGGTVTVSLDANGSRIVYRVRDHGTGIPDFAVHKVFEKFYSLPRPGTQKKSSGLGLAFVREIASLHRGSVTLANHPDGGAVATLTLDRA